MTIIIKNKFPDIEIKSFQQDINRRIAACNARVDRLQNAGGWQAAELEMSYADGLKRALITYLEWCL